MEKIVNLSVIHHPCYFNFTLKAGFHMIAAIAMIVAIAAMTLSDPFDYRFPYDPYDRYGMKKKCPRGPGTNSDVLHSGILSSQRSLQSLESGSHMIRTTATIVEIELKSISAIVVATIATIAGEWFPYDCNDR